MQDYDRSADDAATEHGYLERPKRAAASYIANQDRPAVRGFLDGVTWIPTGVATIYDFHQDGDPYSVHGMVDEEREEPVTRSERAGRAAGAVTGTGVLATVPYVAPATIGGSMVYDVLDGVERTGRRVWPEIRDALEQDTERES